MEAFTGRTSPVHVLIVDDFKPWLDFVHKLLDNVPDLRIVGVAFDGDEAITQAQLLRPDLVLMDISLPLTSGLDAARQIIRLVPDSRIIFVSQKSEPVLVQAAIAAGGRGYVVKLDVCRELLLAMEAVVEGKRYFSRGLLDFDFTETKVM
jgi:two-component system, NarL family, nitrate/nitrite response regulator NarL